MGIIEWGAVNAYGSISACLSGMTLSAVSNKTWLNVEVTLNSSNRVECCIARRRDGGAWVDTTQRELDWHKKTIGGNLEQYSLSAISVLAERAVAALVPR